MTTRTERLLAEFVDRTHELESFRRMLNEPAKPILVLWGGGGLGKSSLVTRLVSESRKEGVTTVHIDEYAHQSYLSVLRSIRDQVAPAGFDWFTDLVNYFTVRNYTLQIEVKHEGSIEVGRGANVVDSKDVHFTGLAVNIQDLNLLEPRTDMDVPEKERMARLTTRFLDDLATVTATQRVVVFFDAAEKMPQDTQRWLWERLLAPLMDGAMPNLRIVVAGREQPQLSRDMRQLVNEAHLVPLGLEHVIDYLARRGVEEEHRQELAMMVMGMAKGVPHMIAVATDSYLETKQSHGV